MHQDLTLQARGTPSAGHLPLCPGLCMAEVLLEPLVTWPPGLSVETVISRASSLKYWC